MASIASENYSKMLAKSLYDLRKQNQLCDITIKVDGRAFQAHKNVLAAGSSSYFHKMFTSEFKESGETEISIDGKPEIFEELLDFIYTGEMSITFETARDLLEMANYMQLPDAPELCCKFIADTFKREECNTKYGYSSELLPVDDVVRIYHLAKSLELPDIVYDSEKYMCCHLQQLKTSQVFLEIADVVFLETNLKKEDFSSEDEEKEVFVMVINWLRYDWDNRHQHASLLLGLIRLGQVPEEKLTELLDERILEKPGCKLLLQQTQEALSTICSKEDRVKQLPNLFATRSTRPVLLCMYAYEFETKEIHVQFYNQSEDKYPSEEDNDSFEAWNSSWSLLEWNPDDCDDYMYPNIPTLCTVGNQLYAAGGLKVRYDDDNEFMSWVMPLAYNVPGYRHTMPFPCVNNFGRYDSQLNRWNDLPPMNDARRDFQFIHLDGFLYAIGGIGSRDRWLNCMERFNIDEMSWQRRAALPEGYRWVSAIPYQGMILAYGVKGSDHIITMYNPDKNVWDTKLHETHTQRDTDDSTKHDNAPVLLVHKGQCYRILHQKLIGDAASSVPSSRLGRLRQPRGNKLAIQNAHEVSIGEEVNQDLIPPNEIGAFRIEDEVFVSLKGCAHQTDVQVQEGQCTDVVLDKWRYFYLRSNDIHSNVVYLTVDLKKMKYYQHLKYM